MDTLKNTLFEVNNGISLITINRPQALNALNEATMRELEIICDRIAGDQTVKVVIITGAGEKAFVAGADIAEMKDMTSLQGRSWGKYGQEVFNKLEKLPQPVIAAINGFALGGGCELAMACDIRIASEKAKFGQPEVGLGITPGFAGTQRLPRLVGRGIAKELLFTGEIINADTALRIGLVNKVVQGEELLNTARAMAKKISSNAPVAVQFCKASVNEGLDMDNESAFAYEAEVFGLCFSTVDQKEGMTAFTEKRKASFIGK